MTVSFKETCGSVLEGEHVAVSLKGNMWQCPCWEHVTVEIINFIGLKK